MWFFIRRFISNIRKIFKRDDGVSFLINRKLPWFYLFNQGEGNKEDSDRSIKIFKI